MLYKIVQNKIIIDDFNGINNSDSSCEEQVLYITYILVDLK